jgi:hypothetical protein
MENLIKRETCYCQKPTIYEISCDLCGGVNITWSEYEHMIWCYDCQKDTPGNAGIFDGPIPLQICNMVGISFDKIEISTGDMLYMHIQDGKIYWDKIPEERRKAKEGEDGKADTNKR